MPIASHQNTIIGRHYQYLKHNQTSQKITVGLLRTSRFVNREARDMFYGGNKWRFSGVNVWMAANTFLFTIGYDSFQCIKSITLPTPFEVRLANPPLHMVRSNPLRVRDLFCVVRADTLQHPKRLEVRPQLQRRMCSAGKHCKSENTELGASYVVRSFMH